MRFNGFMDFRRVSQEQREKLYMEVWKEKLPIVAQRYGISDATLRKHCKKLWIPLPGVGYWAKIQSGKNIEPIKLPEVRGELKKYVYNYVIKYKTDIEEITDEELINGPELNLLRTETIDAIKKVISNISVGKQLRNPDKLILEHREESAYRKKRDKELNGAKVNSDYYRLIKSKHRDNNAMLAINVSDKNIHRAYIIIDTIIKALIELEGYTINRIDGDRDISCFVIMQSHFYFELKEEKEKLVLSMIARDWFKETSEYKLNFKDDAHGVLEDKIDEIIYKMFVTANKLMCECKIRDREWKREMEAKERERELEKKRQKELENLKLLEDLANKWEQAEKIRKFIVEVECKFKKECNENKKEEYRKFIVWATKRVEWLDPLIADSKQFNDVINYVLTQDI